MDDNSQPSPKPQKLIYKELFQDRALVSLIGAGTVLAVVAVIRVLLGIQHYDIDIPVRYTQFGGVDSYISGDWYTHYEFVAFAVLTLLANSYLALRIYRHRRWISISILSLQIVILIFLLVISGAIIDTLPVAA